MGFVESIVPLGWRHRRWVGATALLALLMLGACDSDEGPTYPGPPMSTELTIAFDTVPQGEWVNPMIRFSATSEEDVVIRSRHNPFTGYRVTSADGALIMEFPSQEVGSPWEIVVRPGWDIRVVFNVPTARAQIADPSRLVAWLSEDEILPAGEYLLEAGLYERENSYPWGEATFTVVAEGTPGR